MVNNIYKYRLRYIVLYGPFGLAGLSIHRFMATAVNNQLKSRIYGTRVDTLDSTCSIRSIRFDSLTHLRYLPSGILLKGEIIVARGTTCTAPADGQATRSTTHRGVGDNADLTLRLAIDDMDGAVACCLVAAISVGQHMARRMRCGGVAQRVQLASSLGGHG